MVDVHDTATRRRNMAAVRHKDTRPELKVRKALHGAGFRYRLHDPKLPGKPDIVLPKHKAVVFVHGCFWHGHQCELFRWPRSNEAFWAEKINSNRQRDELAYKKLEDRGWKVCEVWECATKGKTRLSEAALLKALETWIKELCGRLTISGQAQ
ncbi:MAG: DNA mismatch endonuclease Vsr [Fimbriimonadaceae bacterium]